VSTRRISFFASLLEVDDEIYNILARKVGLNMGNLLSIDSNLHYYNTHFTKFSLYLVGT